MVDGGGALFKSVAVSNDQIERKRLKAQAALIASSLAAMGIQAVNVGRQDLTEGVAFLRELANRNRLLWLSANIVDQKGANLFPPSVKLAWGDRTAFVFGLTFADRKSDAAMGMGVEDPVATARMVVATAPAGATVICLTDLGYQEEHELLRQVPRINIVIGGGAGAKSLGNPVPIGSALLLRASDRGRELGVFDLATAGEKEWRAPLNLARAVEARLQIEALKGAVTKDRGATPDVSRTVEDLAAEADGLALPPGPKFLNRLISLDSTIPDDVAIAGRVSAFGKEFPAPKQNNAQSGKANQLEPGYNAGSMSCRKCHEKAYKKWTLTTHSRSMVKLPKDKRADEKCFVCHATALDMQGRAGREPVVGCEACHGKGSAHPGVGKVTRKVGAGVCAGCHKGEHDGKPFDYGSGLARIRCDAG